jgi:branched-chain amino acid transport system permease protein
VNEDLTNFAQVVLSGVTIGSIYALIGLGFVLLFKATTVANFAYGEAVMIGAYFGVIFHVDWEVPYWAAIVLALVASGVAAVVVERLALRPLMKASPATVILGTLAVGQILRSGARILRGDELILFPPIFQGNARELFGVFYTPLQIGVLGCSVLLMVALGLFFKYARWGKAMRAVSQNRNSAALMGISVSVSISLAWAISGGLAAASGMLIAPITLVSPEMGFIAFKGFIAAILGGFTREPGVIVGGFALGIIENMSGFYVSTAFQDVITFALLIAILAVRPAGLLSDKTLVKKV